MQKSPRVYISIISYRYIERDENEYYCYRIKNINFSDMLFTCQSIYIINYYNIDFWFYLNKTCGDILLFVFRRLAFLYDLFIPALTGRLEGNASDAQHACVGSVRCFRVRARQTGDGRRREADG